MSGEPQVWELAVDGRHHRVEASGSFQRTVRWLVDGVLVAEQRSSDDRIRVTPTPPDGEEQADPSPGAVLVRYSSLGKPRRATLFAATDGTADLARVMSGVGGLDLEPAPGSPAATYEERLRVHPRRYAVLRAAGAVAGIVVPLLLAALAARFVISLPRPDLPDLPWPDLPRIPWPDLPAIPWPDWSLPDWSLPGWVRRLLGYVDYVWPVVLALLIARAELRRRRKQDQLRARLRAEAGRAGDDEHAEHSEGEDADRRHAERDDPA